MIMHSFACPRQAAQVCLACGTRVCACHGTARGTCPVCYRGYLSGWYRPVACGYRGCTALAVAESPRVGRACLHHAVTRGGWQTPSPRRVAEYAQAAPLIEYTCRLLRRPEMAAIAQRLRIANEA
jgi:hypothetical protein